LKRLNLLSLELRRLVADLMWCIRSFSGLLILTSTNFSHSVLFVKLEVIDIKFLNHTVLEYVALSFVRELSMSVTTTAYKNRRSGNNLPMDLNLNDVD